MAMPIVKILQNPCRGCAQLCGRQVAEIRAWSMLQSQPPVENDGTRHALQEIGDPPSTMMVSGQIHDNSNPQTVSNSC